MRPATGTAADRLRTSGSPSAVSNRPAGQNAPPPPEFAPSGIAPVGFGPDGSGTSRTRRRRRPPCISTPGASCPPPRRSPCCRPKRNLVFDGHTRRRSAIDVGIDVLVYYHDFRDEDAAFEYAVANQRDRRDLTDS